MQKTSIRYRIFISYAILIVSILCCTVYISQKSIGHAFQENILQSHQRELILITNCLEVNLEQIKNNEMSVALDPDVINLMKKNPSLPKGLIEQMDLRRNLGRKVNSIVGTNQSVFLWDIITSDNKFIDVSGSGTLKYIAEALDEEYFSVMSKSRAPVLLGPLMIENGSSNEAVLPIFVMSKQIINLDTLSHLGYVVFFISEPSLAKMFEKNMSPELTQSFYVLSSDNQILSSSEKKYIGKDIQESIDLPTEKTEALLKEDKHVEDGKDPNLYSVTPMHLNGWKVVYKSSLKELMESQYYVRKVVTFLGMISCVLSLIIAGAIAHYITYPIAVLSDRMSMYYKDNSNPEVHHISRNEIANLYEGFDTMVNNSKKMIRQIYSDQEEKSKYRFQLVQAQIKPHFLYNTLEMIKSLIDIQMNAEASEAIMAFSKFYRISLNDGNDIISVANELELSKQYMYIQKMRYMEYLDYEIEACAGLSRYVIPKMTLQPLLENAIYHGIKNKQKDGKIRLVVREFSDCLEFVIEDNGIGIEAEELKNILKTLEEGEEKKVVSFGLYSINRRIQLFFGDEYRLSVESQIDKYTRVVFKIPKKCDI